MYVCLGKMSGSPLEIQNPISLEKVFCSKIHALEGSISIPSLITSHLLFYALSIKTDKLNS